MTTERIARLRATTVGSTFTWTSIEKTDLSWLLDRVGKLEAKLERMKDDINTTEAALGISGLYAKKDDEIDSLNDQLATVTAERDRTIKALSKLLSSGGCQDNCIKQNCKKCRASIAIDKARNVLKIAREAREGKG